MPIRHDNDGWVVLPQWLLPTADWHGARRRIHSVRSRWSIRKSVPEWSESAALLPTLRHQSSDHADRMVLRRTNWQRAAGHSVCWRLRMSIGILRIEWDVLSRLSERARLPERVAMQLGQHRGRGSEGHRKE